VGFPSFFACFIFIFGKLGVGGGKVGNGRNGGRERANENRMPPVDAIYRPHVVHHTIVPPDLKAAQVKNKTKRYFSADD
jgi:hypothetical protein